MIRRSLPPAVLALFALGLAGCAQLDPQARFAPVQAQAQTLLKQDLQWPANAEAQRQLDARVSGLLAAAMLSADAAVQIALLNHRSLRAGLHELGIADAALVQASRWPNPGISLGRLRRGGEVEIERGLQFDLLRLLSLAPASRAAEQRLKLVQQEVTLQVLKLAAQARASYWQALAAEQLAHYSRQVVEAAEASAELARRMAQAGNFSALRQAREQNFLAEAMLGQARADGQASARREALGRALGLTGEQLKALVLPERMPDLPASARALADVEQLAIDQRLDVKAASSAAALAAEELGLTRRTRFVNVFELGAVRNSTNEAPTQRGIELRLELPLFDWGEARTAQAEGRYMQAVERTAQVALDARSEAREAHAHYRLAHQIARRYADEIVPLQRRISEENLLRYNGMLIGVFELLADARAQIGAVAAAIEAQRDFFLAEGELEQALLGPAP